MAIVQMVAQRGGTLHLAAPATAGNTLVFLTNARGTLDNPAIYPPTGYTVGPEGIKSSFNGDRGSVCKKTAVGGEQDLLIGGGNDQGAAWFELPGFWDWDQHDNDDGGIAFASTSHSGTITPQSGSFIVAACVVGTDGGWGTHSYSPLAGWSEALDWDGATDHPSGWLGYIDGSSSSPVSADPVCDGSGFWSGLITSLVTASVPPDPGIDVGVYDPDDIFIATLDDAIEKQIKPMLNGTGVGSFKLNRYSPNATADILKGGNLVKVTIPRIDPDPIFSFFLEDEGIVLVSDQEHGGEVISITGNGGLSYLARAVWLASSFVIDWWPATMGTPPAGTRGAVIFTAGTYRRYTIAGGVITGYVNFTTSGFSAYFDSRQTYQWPSANSQRFLVHLTTTEDPASPSHVGHYVHPHQDGVKEYLPSYALNTSIPLTSIGDGDKPGQVLYRMYQEAVAASRPTHPVPLLTVDFTDTLDSNGDAWTTTDALVGVTAELGETYLETLGKLLGTGVLDVVMGVDLELHAYNHYGRDLTGTAFGPGVVRFAKGVNIADQLARQRRPEPVATWAQVIGTNDAVAEAELPDAASRIPRETSIRGETDNVTALEALGLAELNRQLVASDAIAFRITTDDDDEDVGKYLPGPEGTAHGKFWLGDLVTLHTGTGEQDFNEADERVVAVTIAEDEARNLEVTPEVGATLDGGNGLLRSAGSELTGVVAATIADSGSGEPVGDHGALSGLDDDDHPQYTTDAEAAVIAAAAVATGAPAVVITLTNKSGGSVAAGDVVVISTGNDTAFTTTTTGQAEVSVGIAQETIADNAAGRVLLSGYAALVNVPASVTRGHYIETHTVAKQATGSATRRAGSLGQFATGGTTPAGWLWGSTDQTATGGSGDVATDTIWDAKGDLAVGTGSNTAARLAIGSDGDIPYADSGETTGIRWDAPPSGGGGGLLAVVSYNPSGDLTYSLSSTSLADLDATNLVITFTAPASGNVIVRLQAVLQSGTSGDPSLVFGLRESSSQVGPIGIICDANVINRYSIDLYVTGISAGSHTYKLAYKKGSGSSNGTLYYGATARGPVVMEVWEAP